MAAWPLARCQSCTSATEPPKAHITKHDVQTSSLGATVAGPRVSAYMLGSRSDVPVGARMTLVGRMHADVNVPLWLRSCLVTHACSARNSPDHGGTVRTCCGGDACTQRCRDLAVEDGLGGALRLEISARKPRRPSERDHYEKHQPIRTSTTATSNSSHGDKGLGGANDDERRRPGPLRLKKRCDTPGEEPKAALTPSHTHTHGLANPPDNDRRLALR